MKKLVLFAVVLATTFLAGGSIPPVFAASAPANSIQGASSVDSLLDAFIAALSANDEAAMHRLRVSETEYRNIIIPGTTNPGQPLRQVGAEASEYFWSVLNQKSEDIGRLLIQQFGGRSYTREELTLTRGTREFATYKAIGDIRLQLRDPRGNLRELRTGSIAEIEGRYKFIGFNTNN